MIKNDAFAKLIVVFHQAVSEMAEKDTAFERKAVISDWIELMGKVDRAMSNLIMEGDKEVRLKMVKDFEEVLKEFDFVE